MSSWYARSIPNQSNTRNKNTLVSVKLCGDLANRIFQVLAAQHFAEKTGRTFYLTAEFVEENPNDSAGNDLVKLFPDLQFYNGPVVEWNLVQEEAYMMFQYQPDMFKKFPGQHIVLDGSFLNSKYFPKSLPNLNIDRHFPLFFLHIRSESVNDVNLKNYYKDAITSSQKTQKDARFLVFSDDSKNAELYLKSLNIPSLKYTMSTTTNSLDVLKDMASCIGGVCANASLSWLGAFFQKPRGPIFMPSLWMRGLIKNQTNELFPPWVTVIDVRETRR
jgi:hypothetical protein